MYFVFIVFTIGPFVLSHFFLVFPFTANSFQWQSTTCSLAWATFYHISLFYLMVCTCSPPPLPPIWLPFSSRDYVNYLCNLFYPNSHFRCRGTRREGKVLPALIWVNSICCLPSPGHSRLLLLFYILHFIFLFSIESFYIFTTIYYTLILGVKGGGVECYKNSLLLPPFPFWIIKMHFHFNCRSNIAEAVTF